MVRMIAASARTKSGHLKTCRLASITCYHWLFCASLKVPSDFTRQIGTRLAVCKAVCLSCDPLLACNQSALAAALQDEPHISLSCVDGSTPKPGRRARPRGLASAKSVQVTIRRQAPSDLDISAAKQRIRGRLPRSIQSRLVLIDGIISFASSIA
eukprot:6195758-Pleurochrysis_carterae.AAC.1